MVWFGLVWFGLVWFGLVWFGLVWFGLVVVKTARATDQCYRIFLASFSFVNLSFLTSLNHCEILLILIGGLSVKFVH